jgi:hypothetical protein
MSAGSFVKRYDNVCSGVARRGVMTFDIGNADIRQLPILSFDRLDGHDASTPPQQYGCFVVLPRLRLALESECTTQPLTGGCTVLIEECGYDVWFHARHYANYPACVACKKLTWGSVIEFCAAS